MSKFEHTLIFIPAFKKLTHFQDDLVRKLDGTPLVQRAVDKALETDLPSSAVHLLTDSEEIALFGERSGIRTFRDAECSWNRTALTGVLGQYISGVENSNTISMLLSPYAPLLKTATLMQAITVFINSNKDVLQAIVPEKHYLYSGEESSTASLAFGKSEETSYVRSTAFSLYRAGIIAGGSGSDRSVLPYSVDDDALEICSLRDWWICEKLLQRQRIVFRVIGNDQVGMGHIYRALSVAHEMTDHEVLFVTDTKSDVAVRELAGYEYWTGVYREVQIEGKILELKPDLVIFDALDTAANLVLRFRDQGITVVSFEDLGSGSHHTNLTINELYDKPQLSGDNYRWGHEYFFVRDEFQNANPKIFENSVSNLLLTFGGTDQHDRSRKIFMAIQKICKHRGIHIHIVTGPGYDGYERLATEIIGESNVTLTHATGIMSDIMESCDVAITSNGRTVYELAHMNIPSLVIDQHERESSHNFGREDNGFISLGLYESRITESQVKEKLARLLDDGKYRYDLFSKMKSIEFTNSKKSIVDRVLNLNVSNDRSGE